MIALAALAALIFGAKMYGMGDREARRLRFQHDVGITSIPAASPYVRAVYDEPVGTDPSTLARAMQVLSYAGQHQQAWLLKRFFAYCGVQRFLGEGDGCARESVRSAVGKVAALAPDTQWPVEGELESKLDSVLTITLASEDLLKQSTDQSTLRTLTYDGPGILRYNDASSGGYVFIAAHNRSLWEITSFRVHVQFRLPHFSSVEVECHSWMPFPRFSWPHALGPGSEVIGYCQAPDRLNTADFLSAVREAQHDGALSVRVDEFSIKDPPVHIVDLGKAPAHRFHARLSDDLSSPERGFVPDTRQVAGELATADCKLTATCPSAAQTASLALFRFFDVRLPLIPITAGLLMGISIGGLFRRSVLILVVFSALTLAAAVGGWFYLLHGIDSAGGEKGFALLGMARLMQLGAEAFVLCLPALFAGGLMMKPLWRAPQ